MLFDSPAYILFLIIVVAVYWRLNSRRAQNGMLLVASYFFYGWWDWRFLLLMMGSTVLDFFIGLRIGREQNPAKRRSWLIASLVVNFTVLGFFKYFDFFIGSVSDLLAVGGIHHIPLSLLRIILPPGISFYTFQEVAYIVDVYYRRLEPAESFLDYGLFISLFPHLIAGPIQRPSHLLPQVQSSRVWDPVKAFHGVMLILEGLFRKCVIADNCALIANAAFGHRLGGPNVFVTAIGTYAFAWQIYGDFSAYSSIARGSAQLLGFHFMVNFRQPYFAESLQDFWRRWHISLSTWLRDYLYIPLGGNRRGERRTYINLMTTMVLGGLWHGANWTFVVWGAIHGAGLAIERFLLRKKLELRHSFVSVWLRRIIIFHLVCLAWIFFRAESIGAAWDMMGSLTVWQWRPEYGAALRFLAVFIIPMMAIDLLLEKTGGEYVLETQPLAWRFSAGLAMFALLAFFGANEANAFIYFQF
jgi:D-alanyl-lipoteichoic acid acyltransferase DltB (MBOAT superfamily)